MAQGFGTVTFSIYIEDTILPAPIPGLLCDTYTATVKLSSAADMDDLYDYLSKPTEKPSMGGRGRGIVVVEWGPGVRTLTYPTSENDMWTADAILISIVPSANLLYDNQWSVECVWLITSIPVVSV